MARSFTRVGVIGFGTMGSGIAQVAAAAGHQVVVLEISEAAIEAGRRRLTAFLAGGVARGKTDQAAADALLARVTGATDAAALADCDLVIESSTEDLAGKRAVLSTVAAAVGPETVITTNTSSLSITGLAAAVGDPGRFAGLHFFNPAPLMPLVEVVPGASTSPDVVADLVAWARAAGKEPVVAKDQPGFLVNSVFMPYINQAIQAYDDGLASAADLDTAVRLGLGYPKGPLELLDVIGLDVHLHATSGAYADTADPAYAPPPLLRRLVAAGRLGAKAGAGIVPEEDR
jgi:3-hydroxybutyryl-CoA dehydrogenase